MADRFRIVIVDKYPIFREGVVQTLRRFKNFVVVAEGVTAEDAEKLVSEKAPDVLLLEVAVPGSLRAAQAILRAHRNVKVIFLASTEDQEHVSQALHAGVHAYIMKGLTGPELVEAIKTVRGGGRYITPDLAWHLATKPSTPPRQPEFEVTPRLNAREQRVLDYASSGLTNKEIARMMGLALGTVKYYKTLAFRKMGVRNRLEAMVAANKLAKQN